MKSLSSYINEITPQNIKTSKKSIIDLKKEIDLNNIKTETFKEKMSKKDSFAKELSNFSTLKDDNKSINLIDSAYNKTDLQTSYINKKDLINNNVSTVNNQNIMIEEKIIKNNNNISENVFEE
jgi:hypothetical protein